MMMPTASSGVHVIHFQRKPRPGFNFSIEGIFENLRGSLKDKIVFTIAVCSRFNDGYLSKLFNIIEAASRQKKNAVSHITGEVHFLNLLMRKKNVLLTIHDCRFMERKTGIQKKMIGWLYLKAPIRKAAFVTAVSETTKHAVIGYTGCAAEKIKVIPVPVNNIFKPLPKAFNKERPVILQVGTAENKNLSRLIEAVRDVQCRLVIIGNVAPADMEKLNRYGIDFRIQLNLSDTQLYHEYANCDMLAFVSTYEGFGMPIVEANCVERAVITSNISSMPEVAGDAACLVDPFDVASVRKGLLKIMNDDAYREQLIASGRRNRQRFSSEAIAGAYYELYKTMVEQL